MSHTVLDRWDVDAVSDHYFDRFFAHCDRQHVIRCACKDGEMLPNNSKETQVFQAQEMAR